MKKKRKKMDLIFLSEVIPVKNMKMSGLKEIPIQESLGRKQRCHSNINPSRPMHFIKLH